jgi:hypothetical protein
MVMLFRATVASVMSLASMRGREPLLPLHETMVRCGDVGFDANQIANAFVAVTPLLTAIIPASAFERLQVGDDVGNLIGLEPELRHRGMAGDNPLGQGSLQVFNRIFEMQRAKRRRNRQGAVTDPVDGVALRAMNAHECQTSLCGRRLCEDGLSSA